MKQLGYFFPACGKGIHSKGLNLRIAGDAFWPGRYYFSCTRIDNDGCSYPFDATRYFNTSST